MIYAVLGGLFLTLTVPLIFRISNKFSGWIISLIPLGIFVYFVQFYSEITAGRIIKETYAWVPSLGINFDFYLDGLSLTFALIISFIGFVVFLFASSYLENHKYIKRLYVYLLIFMSAMLGLVTSDNLITLFVFWELTSISSYLLIGFKHQTEKSRYAALQALFITGFGGLVLLAGFIFVFIITGSWSVSNLAGLNEFIIEHKFYLPAILLVLIGAFTKSAQFPFHFWLPNAMEAPTPISAYLHSATMVKAGIYLIARLNPGLGGTDYWQYIILFTGAVTMVFAAFLSLKQNDLKKLLAYSTLSVLGTLVMLLGIGSDLAIKAFMIYLIAHSLYKGTLFLVAGILDHETGTRDVNILGGLIKYMPITAFIAILASLSKMGIVPLIGFIGKETVYASALEFLDFGFLFIGLAILANIFIVYITITVGFKPFVGAFKETPKTPHEAPFRMWIGPSILAVAGLLLGSFPTYIINSLINFSELGIITEKLNIPVKLWHGFTIELLLSLLTVLLGFLVYLRREKILGLFSSVSFVKYIKPSYYYDLVMRSISTVAIKQSNFFQNGYLRYYIATILLITLLLSGYVIFNSTLLNNISLQFQSTLYEIILAIIIAASVILTITAKSRLTAIIGIGVIGFTLAVFFIIYSAPDLALTQFAIEVLTIILFVLVIYKLPKYLKFSSNPGRIRDIIISVSFGAMMTIITLILTSSPLQSGLKEFFASNSLSKGKGQNIVNVILVDFRAMDTLGEITVLAVAAIGVYALLKLAKGKER